MIVRKTKPEEYRRVNEIFSICFETPYSECPALPENDKAVHWAAFDDDGEMMSTITISDFPIQFDGHACKMGGVGGVDTLPQYRRRGGIRACFNAALHDMYANGYDFSYLYPFSTAYYRQFGYESCVQKYAWTVDLGQLHPPKMDGTFRLAEKHRPLTAAIRSIDAVWESHFNMMVLHSEEDYGWTEKADPAGKVEFTYVYFSADGTPKAYTTFRIAAEADGRNLNCSRFCFADKEGFAGLLGLFKSLSADHAYAKFLTPAIPALQYLMPEWSLGAAKWSILANGGMVRAVNVKNVLQKAKYQGCGRLTLSILDDQIPENTGVYAVSFSDGRAVSVETTDEAPDAVLSIPAFSALIAGVCDFSEARSTLSGLEIRNESACFHSVFCRKPMMIVDAF